MIKANELRIGNWVESDGVGYNKYQITELNNDTGSYLNPIPITPEILQKCGFALLSQLPRGLKHYYSEKLKGYLVEHFNFYRWNDFETPIKFLHQLQNLHFTLTGEELNYCP